MHHDLTLFITITMAILTAFTGGYIARKLGLPTLVGYLLAGMMIGPFTPGFVGDSEAISQLAEMGVIFMMFGVGLHFSLKDLWSVRRIAIPGAAMQTLIATLFGYLLTQTWGWSSSASLVLGLAISVASTVVLLRGLTDNGLLNTSHGKVAVGWLVFEDLATIAILVLLPVLVGGGGTIAESIVLALIKAAIFAAIMLFIGARVMPWLLTRIAYTRSRELFILAVVALALGTALGAAELFGMSLALGAFLAGVIVGGSDVSHQVGAEVIPFRDVFAVLFFVSVGMLVNPAVVLANAGQVVALTGLVIFGKAVITLLLSFILPSSALTLLVVAAGLSQIGEFSFIVGQAGVSLGVLTQDQYGLILASAVISIIVNPFMYHLLPFMERALQSIPGFWQRMERGGPTPELLREGMKDHLVIIGYGRVGKHIVQVLRHLNISCLVVEQDAARASEIQKEGVKTLFGDAANSEVLNHAGLDQARALVITVPNETTAELITATADEIAPQLPIIVRASTDTGVQRLAAHGAHYIIHPELEGSLEIVRHTLLILDYPMEQIQRYVDTIRQDSYVNTPEHEQYRALDQLVSAVRGVEIAWLMVTRGSPIVGQSLAEANLRARFGASIIALMRDHKVFPNPKSDFRFSEGDLVGFIGNREELAATEGFLSLQADITEVHDSPPEASATV